MVPTLFTKDLQMLHEVYVMTGPKRYRCFHVNMLKPWFTPHVLEVLIADATVDHDHDQIVDYQSSTDHSSEIAETLTEKQRVETGNLLDRWKDLFAGKPGSTSLECHAIPTGDSLPIRVPPYRIPLA